MYAVITQNIVAINKVNLIQYVDKNKNKRNNIK